MRAEHLWNAQRARARASASRAPPRPAGESHARLALPTSVCAMLLDSKMRPHIVLRQAEQQVSIAQALSACDKKATVWPHAARCGGSEAPSVLRGGCGLCGAGCAALRGPFAKSSVLVSRLTCISSVPLIAFTRRSDTPSASRVALCPPRTRWEGTSKEPTRPATTGARALRESEWQWQRARGMRTVPPQVRTGRPSSVGKVEFLLIATSRSVQNRVPRIRS
jgi:hypothetical protein